MQLSDVLSTVAIAMSAVSLGWQAWAHRREGPVVKVTTTQAIFTAGPREWFVNVTARNTGRGPVTVTSCGLRVPGGGAFHAVRRLEVSTPLPHRLEPGTEAKWFVERNEILQGCSELGVRYQDLVGFVTLATGNTVLASRKGIGLK